jgi:hypothetical protein
MIGHAKLEGERRLKNLIKRVEEFDEVKSQRAGKKRFKLRYAAWSGYATQDPQRSKPLQTPNQTYIRGGL